MVWIKELPKKVYELNITNGVSIPMMFGAGAEKPFDKSWRFMIKTNSIGNIGYFPEPNYLYYFPNGLIVSTRDKINVTGLPISIEELNTSPNGIEFLKKIFSVPRNIPVITGLNVLMGHFDTKNYSYDVRALIGNTESATANLLYLPDLSTIYWQTLTAELDEKTEFSYYMVTMIYNPFMKVPFSVVFGTVNITKKQTPQHPQIPYYMRHIRRIPGAFYYRR